MLKIKKIGISISLMLLLLLTSSVSFASDGLASDSFISNDNEVLVYESAEITDQAELFDRAVKQISDEPVKTKQISTLTENGQNISTDKIKTYTTVQKLKEKKDLQTGKTTSYYRQDSFAVIPKSMLDSEVSKTSNVDKTTFRVALIDQDQDYDPSVSVLVTSKIYYSYFNCLNRNFYKFSKVSGTYNILDSQVTMSNAKVGYYNLGTVVNSNCAGNYGNQEYNTWTVSSSPVSGTEYSHSINSYYYYSNGSSDINSGSAGITLRRGTTTWQYTYTNMFLD